jgi:uncharacterized protein YdeI (YjbR/CyaY-like superfamily)
VEELEGAIAFADRHEWRRWLERHHAEAPEVWLLYFKRHTCRPSVVWAEAVEEALCFGWIDGKVKRVDEDRYLQRWTPRRPTSRWSKVNTEIVERLIADGRMTEAGMAAVRIAKERGAWDAAYRVQPKRRPSPALKEALAAEPEARRRFSWLTHTMHNRTLDWVEAAGDPDEAARRIGHVVESFRAGTKPSLD